VYVTPAHNHYPLQGKTRLLKEILSQILRYVHFNPTHFTRSSTYTFSLFSPSPPPLVSSFFSALSPPPPCPLTPALYPHSSSSLVTLHPYLLTLAVLTYPHQFPTPSYFLFPNLLPPSLHSTSHHSTPHQPPTKLVTSFSLYFTPFVSPIFSPPLLPPSLSLAFSPPPPPLLIPPLPPSTLLFLFSPLHHQTPTLPLPL